MFSEHYRFPSGAETSVVVGRQLPAVAQTRLSERPAQAVFVLADPAVEGQARAWAQALGAVACWTVPGGEAVKRMEVWAALAERLSVAGAERGALILAIGGGSLCDLVGFLAATYRRGVRVWLVPTTSLAMCDAALGGKNGLDLGALKNAVGTIRQPEVVFCDLDFLQTLSASGRRGGLAELAKMAAVLDAEAFLWLETQAAALLNGDQAAWEAAVVMAIRLKLEVVIADEFERDRRRWLNFGHTLGHALESASGYQMPHGDAVALGMLAECRAVATPVHGRLRQLLLALGLPTEPFGPVDLEQLWALAQQDKKTQAGRVMAVVPDSIGSGRVVVLERDHLPRAFGLV